LGTDEAVPSIKAALRNRSGFFASPSNKQPVCQVRAQLSDTVFMKNACGGKYFPREAVGTLIAYLRTK